MELLVDRLHYLARHVQPGEVEQLERPHAKAGRFAHQAIDICHAGNPLFQNPEALGIQSAPGMIDQEAGLIFSHHRSVARGSH
ncbi:hypothetical protein D9M68_666750 [compost metagenome]